MGRAYFVFNLSGYGFDENVFVGSHGLGALIQEFQIFVQIPIFAKTTVGFSARNENCW